MCAFCDKEVESALHVLPCCPLASSLWLDFLCVRTEYWRVVYVHQMLRQVFQWSLNHESSFQLFLLVVLTLLFLVLLDDVEIVLNFSLPM